MSRRIKSGQRRPAPHSLGLVEQWTEEQAYDSSGSSMLYVVDYIELPEDLETNPHSGTSRAFDLASGVS